MSLIFQSIHHHSPIKRSVPVHAKNKIITQLNDERKKLFELQMKKKKKKQI